MDNDTIPQEGSAPVKNITRDDKRKLSLFSRETRKGIRPLRFKFPLITGQALKDMFTLRRIVIYLIILCVVPVIAAMLVPNSISSYPREMQLVKLTDYMFTLSFLWIAGIPLIFMSAGMVSSMVSSELTEGTMLQLITKPVRRWEVIVGKFLAFFILFAVVEILAFVLSSYLLVYFSGCHLSVF